MEWTSALGRYAGQLHRATGMGHHVVSPLGAWLLLALVGHYLTLARAYLQVGGIGRAARALDTSTRIAPGEAHSPLHQAIRLQIGTA